MTVRVNSTSNKNNNGTKFIYRNVEIDCDEEAPSIGIDAVIKLIDEKQ